MKYLPDYDTVVIPPGDQVAGRSKLERANGNGHRAVRNKLALRLEDSGDLRHVGFMEGREF